MATMRWRGLDGHIYEYMGDEGSGSSKAPTYMSASSGPIEPIMTSEEWHKLSTHISDASDALSLSKPISLYDGARIGTSIIGTTDSKITGEKTFVGEYEGKDIRLVANDDGTLSWEIFDEEGEPIKIDVSSGIDLAKELDDLKRVREDGTWSSWEESRRKRSDLYSELDEARKLAKAGERRWKVALERMEIGGRAPGYRHPRTSEEFND